MKPIIVILFSAIVIFGIISYAKFHGDQNIVELEWKMIAKHIIDVDFGDIISSNKNTIREPEGILSRSVHDNNKMKAALFANWDRSNLNESTAVKSTKLSMDITDYARILLPENLSYVVKEKELFHAMDLDIFSQDYHYLKFVKWCDKNADGYKYLEVDITTPKGNKFLGYLILAKDETGTLNALFAFFCAHS